MRRDPRAFLWDMREACELVFQFSAGLSRDLYRDDALRRSAIERQLTTLGEAMAQLAKIDPALAQQIPDCPQIVAFRNILVHGYRDLDQARV